MLVRDGDVASPSNYTTIRGVLRGVGHHAQVYVAAEDLADVDPDLLKDLINTFDDRIYPFSCRRFGEACDVDGDGRFTILLSSWLDRLGSGRHAVDGFVRVSDLDSAFRAPFGNQCDMMYLSSSLKPGPFVRTLLAHEYMHAVIFSQKLKSGGARRVPSWKRRDGSTRRWPIWPRTLMASRLQILIIESVRFCLAPERYQLVVDDYFAANLFRSHGNRGSTYLFLRWCADRYGPDLLPALVASDRRGMANLESATGASFSSLFRRWSLALYLSGLDPDPPKRDSTEDGAPSLNLRSPHEKWELAGPRYQRLSPDAPPDRWMASGTTSHFVVVDGSRSPAVQVEVKGPPDAELQVTALPLGSSVARLDLSIHKSSGPEGELRLRARIKERHGVEVRLSAAFLGAVGAAGKSSFFGRPQWTPGYARNRLGVRDVLTAGERRALVSANPFERDLLPDRPTRSQGHRHRCRRPSYCRMGRCQRVDRNAQRRALKRRGVFQPVRFCGSILCRCPYLSRLRSA